MILHLFILLSLPLSSLASKCGRKGEADEISCPLTSLSANVLHDFSVKRIQIPSSEHFPFQGLERRTHHLGTCAVVGLSESLLSCKYGENIDSKHTVFRIGFSPLSRFASHVGVKTTYTLCRSSSCEQAVDNQSERKVNKKSWTKKGRNASNLRDIYGFMQLPEYKNAKLVIRYRAEERHHTAKTPSRLYVSWSPTNISQTLMNQYVNHTGPKSSTSGFALAIDLLFSKLCEEIHVYGMGGKLKRYSYTVDGGRLDLPREIRGRTQNMKRNHSPTVEISVYNRLKLSGYPITLHNCDVELPKD